MYIEPASLGRLQRFSLRPFKCITGCYQSEPAKKKKCFSLANVNRQKNLFSNWCVCVWGSRVRIFCIQAASAIHPHHSRSSRWTLILIGLTEPWPHVPPHPNGYSIHRLRCLPTSLSPQCRNIAHARFIIIILANLWVFAQCRGELPWAH